MTGREETILRAYLRHDDAAFDALLALREEPDGEATFKQTLALAKEWWRGYQEGARAMRSYVEGFRMDLRLQPKPTAPHHELFIGHSGDGPR